MVRPGHADADTLKERRELAGKLPHRGIDELTSTGAAHYVPDVTANATASGFRVTMAIIKIGGNRIAVDNASPWPGPGAGRDAGRLYVAPTEPSPTPTLAEPYRRTIDELFDNNELSDLQRAILADYWVNDAEMREAQDAMRQRITEAHPDLTVTFDPGGGARAVATAPDLLLVDEPTAQLDLATAATVNRVLAGIAQDDTVVVVATHDPHTRDACPRVVDLAQHQAPAEPAEGATR